MGDDKVAVGAYAYNCILGHTAAATNKPGEGASWATYWEILQSGYEANDLVSDAGLNYICTDANTPSSSNRPGIGADWADYWEIQVTGNLIFYVDSGKTLINPGEISEMTGLGHLEGEEVQVVANGAVLTPRTVTGGKITFDQDGDPTTFTDVSAGLGYVSILEPMALEAAMQNGTSASREKRIHELVIYFHNTYGGMTGDSLDGDFDRIPFYDTGDADSPALFSGPLLCPLEQRHKLDASFVLKQELPMPFQILAIVPKYNTYGDNI